MFEKIILQNLINNQKYGSLFLPFLKPEYFEGYDSKIVFNHINTHFNDYQKFPHWNELLITVSNDNLLDENGCEKSISLINEVKSDDTYNPDWLIKETKKYIRNKAFELVIIESADRLNNQQPIDEMVKKVQDVFSITFDETIGHSYFRDFEQQFEYYHEEKEKFECNISSLNTACDGGVERKTLNMLMAPTNTGKTSGMISLASSYLRRGYNVLYVTAEMSEENIRQRIDANFFKTAINDIPKLSKSVYCGRIAELRAKYKANLYVKEYPTASANVNNVRALLDALRTKENFVPDIVFIDYLNIMASTRFKSENSYNMVKGIAEEFRGLAVEYNMCFWSATQTNRGGDGASDLDLTDQSDSYGVPMTADMQIAIIQTPEMFEQMKQIWKILKTRYSKMKNFKFAVNHDFDTCQVNDLGVAKEETKTDAVDNEPEIKTKFNKLKNKERMKEMSIDFS